LSPLFKRKTEFKVVQPAAKPTEQAAQSLPPVPLPPPTKPKSEDETELEALKQRWAQALHDYAYGRFSDKTVVLNGKCYYKHKVLNTNQSPGLLSETWIGVNQEVAPVLVKVDYLYNAMGLLRVDVDEKPIGKDKAAEAGLTVEEVLKILNMMEKLELSW
jgi:hypothetical protein